jgi:glycosyltransferase involved in cell wall biosynthesis
LREGLGIADDEKTLLAVGRLSREKGHADLIESVALLRTAEPDLKFKLLIVGDGPEQANLTRAVCERKLDSHVVFVGHVTDVAPFYAIADLLALPSHSEGSPNVLLEAMAAGLPIVATSVGGVPEIATSEVNALLVPPRNPSPFAEALRRALTDVELARTLKNNAIARAKDFSPECHARSLIEIYQELVSVQRPIGGGSYAQARLHDPLAIARGTDTI